MLLRILTLFGTLFSFGAWTPRSALSFGTQHESTKAEEYRKHICDIFCFVIHFYSNIIAQGGPQQARSTGFPQLFQRRLLRVWAQFLIAFKTAIAFQDDAIGQLIRSLRRESYDRFQ